MKTIEKNEFRKSLINGITLSIYDDLFAHKNLRNHTYNVDVIKFNEMFEESEHKPRLDLNKKYIVIVQDLTFKTIYKAYDGDIEDIKTLILNDLHLPDVEFIMCSLDTKTKMLRLEVIYEIKNINQC